MKIKYYSVMIVIGLVCLLPVRVMAKEKRTLYFFHGNTCVHCQAAWEYLNEIAPDYPNIEVVGYEVFDDAANEQLLSQVKDVLESDSRGVPFFVIGERYLTGFNETRKEDLKAIMDYYLEHPDEYQDVVKKVVSGEYVKEEKDNIIEEVHPVNMNQMRRKEMIQNILIFSGLLIVLSGILVALHKKW